MKRVMIVLFTIMIIPVMSNAEPPKSNSSAKSKFYDFSEQVIDGEIRRPTGTFTNSRERARFNRLLRLKRSFLPDLFATSKERVFK